MGLLQKACETYDAHAHLAGETRDGHETLAPVSHTLTSAQLEIVLDPEGSFVTARLVNKSEPKTVIPVTEESAGRTSAPTAHPLCEQIGYVAPVDARKHTLYVEQLTKWAESDYSHPALLPILTYVRSGTVLSDLIGCGLISLNEKGAPENEKLMIRWQVVGLDVPDGRVWRDKSLFNAFVCYYSAQNREREKVVDMISGEIDIPAFQHPKGVIAMDGNAKLISANDESGFTYRGRFTDGAQTCTVSYLSSQKAHNALRWLAADQGVIIGGRTFLCWNPRGIAVPRVTNPLLTGAEVRAVQPTEYKTALDKAIFGYKSVLPDGEDVVIASFDAATSGRLAVTYFSELKASTFLEHLYLWDSSCCWVNGPFGIQAPPLYQIVDCAFGTARLDRGRETLTTDDRIKRQHIQRLIACRVDCVKMPLDIEQAIVKQASNQLKFGPELRRKVVYTACAVIRKYRYDAYKEEWSMALEPDKKDISYQYGRLLAIMERAELDYYRKTGEERETNAIKMLDMFCNRPWHVWEIVNRQLRKAYIPRLDKPQRDRYNRLTDEIVDILAEFPESERNKQLKDVYLLGYYNQRSEFFKSNKNEGENSNGYSEE